MVMQYYSTYISTQVNIPQICPKKIKYGAKKFIFLNEKFKDNSDRLVGWDSSDQVRVFYLCFC